MPDHAVSADPAVQAQLDRLTMLSPGRDVLGLDRIGELCARLGNPQDQLPPVFHVAGTNGKGSTCAFLRSAIEAAGMTAHVYSSPHLVRFNERIRVAGKLIDDPSLAPLLAEVLDHAEGLQASFFEVTTAAAFLAFARAPADAAIFEVGLGGRLDATNVVERPAACGIAALGIDHEAFLLSEDETAPSGLQPLERIAWEKAGIAKAGAPLVCQRYDKAVQMQIAQAAMAVGAQMVDRGDGWNAAVYDGQLRYSDAHGNLALPLPRMAGTHQADNAALAVAMLRHQDAINVPPAAMAAAMEWASWPARLQKLGTGPLTLQLPPVAGVWLDGGHNRQAGEAIAAHFNGHAPRSIHLIIGMLSNKDPAALIQPLWDRLASITVVPVPGHDCHDSAAFEGAADKLPVASAVDVHSATAALVLSREDSILIAGSLYLAGEMLKANGETPA